MILALSITVVLLVVALIACLSIVRMLCHDIDMYKEEISDLDAKVNQLAVDRMSLIDSLQKVREVALFHTEKRNMLDVQEEV